MNITSFGKQVIHDLGAIYDAEKQFLLAQQQLRANAQSPLLRELLDEHTIQTRQQIANLEQIFGLLNLEPVAVNDDAATGLVMSGRQAVDEASASPAMTDCMIATAISKVEHYESACYRALIAAVNHTGHVQLIQLLQQNLDQEQQAAARAEDAYQKLLDTALASQKLQRAVGETPFIG